MRWLVIEFHALETVHKSFKTYKEAKEYFNNEPSADMLAEVKEERS